MPDAAAPAPVGVPPGLVGAVLTILRSHGGGPVKRRTILKELEGKGHRISLAGLNRALDHTARAGTTRETPDGVQLVPAPRGEGADLGPGAR